MVTSKDDWLAIQGNLAVDAVLDTETTETTETAAMDRQSIAAVSVVSVVSVSKTALPEERLQSSSPAVMPELEESLFLDLTDSLASDAEQSADVLESHRVFTVETEV